MRFRGPGTWMQANSSSSIEMESNGVSQDNHDDLMDKSKGSKKPMVSGHQFTGPILSHALTPWFLWKEVGAASRGQSNRLTKCPCLARCTAPGSSSWVS